MNNVLLSEDDFIKHFYPLANSILSSYMVAEKKRFGWDLVKSAAYEGCWKAYQLLNEKYISEYKIQKGYVRICSKRCFWNLAIAFKYIPSSGQIYFPKKWISYEEYFRNRSEQENFYDILDSRLIMDMIQEFPEKEVTIYQMFVAGYDFSEIAQTLGETKSSPLKKFRRSCKKLKKIIQRPILECNECSKAFKNEGKTRNKKFCSKKCERKNTSAKYYLKKRNG